jgi:hypothetical protein
MDYSRSTVIKVTMNHAKKSFSTEICAAAIVSGVHYLTLLRQSFGLLGHPALQFLQPVATAAAVSSIMSGPYLTLSSYVAGARREVSVALVKGIDVLYRKALHARV